MKDLNDILYNKPLYPSDTPFEEKPKEQTSSFMGENLQSILPLILGMQSGNKTEMLTKFLPKNMTSNPLFQTLSTFGVNKTKKESISSPKKILKDEIF